MTQLRKTTISSHAYGLYVLLLLSSGVLDAAEPSPWTPREMAILQSMTLKANVAVPPSYSNRYADNDEAVVFGKALFFDNRASANGLISCASCHQPDKYFTDGLARSVGAGRVMRNAPTVVGAAYNRWFYWDGRRDSLWSQALIPFEAPDEMGSNRLAIIRLVAADETYRDSYTKIFGDSLAELDLNSLPENAGPYGGAGMRDAWYRLGNAKQSAINRVYSNIGKAIEAYERTLIPTPSRFDKYVASLSAATKRNSAVEFSPDEVAGAKLFMSVERTQCLQCHNGPQLTNGDFHNIGTGNFSGDHLDFGRSVGLRAVLMDEFNCIGPYSDAASGECAELIFLNRDSHLPLEGAFKVPSLRGLASTSPYFHDGRFETITEVLLYYSDPPTFDEVGPHELKTLDISDVEIGQLESFLLTLAE